MTTLVSTLTVLCTLAGANAGAVSLNEANIDEHMAGKGAFIKFQAPW